MTMRHWNFRDWAAFGVVLGFTLIVLAKCAGAEPCFPSKEALKAAFPHASHYSWTYRDGPTRYYVGEPRRVKCDEPEREVMQTESRRQHRPQGIALSSRADHDSRPRPAKRLAGAVPLPLERPALPVDPAADGTRLADEIWSWPDMTSPSRAARDYGKVLLAKAMRQEAAARAAKVAEWRR